MSVPSTKPAGMSTANKRWAMGALVAVAMHSAGGILIWNKSTERKVEPQTVITVELAAQSESAPSSAATQTLAVEPQSQPQIAPVPKTTANPQKQIAEQPPEQAQKSPEPKSEPVVKPTPKTKSSPVSQTASKPSEKTTELPAAEPAKTTPTQLAQQSAPARVPALSGSTAEPAPLSKTAAASNATSKTAATASSAAASSTSAAASSTSAAASSTSAAQTPASTKAGKKATQNYYAMISAHLNRNKSYSAAAKKQQLTGVVTVRFTVEPSGAISASSIQSSSGHPLLDDETLKLLTRVSPLPPMPKDMAQKPVTISLPINYQLQTR